MIWVYLFLLVAICLLFMYLTGVRWKTSEIREPDSYPEISVLIAFRDEELHIESCIKSLLDLNYDPLKVEFLFGDDHSRDQSPEIVKKYEIEDDRVKYCNIEADKNGLVAKANVLAQLIEMASGEYLLITDADSEVNPEWAKEMISEFDEHTGMVNGVTRIKSGSIGSKLQDMEWVVSIGLLKILTDTIKPVTGIGNNMALSKKVYQEIGGLESAPRSLTEDHSLFSLILKKRFKVKQVFNSASLVCTKAEENLIDLVQQRRRWMNGAKSIPWYVQSILILMALRGPLYAYIFYLHYDSFELSILLILIGLDANFTRSLYSRLKLKLSIWLLLIFPFYHSFMTLLTLLAFLWPSRLKWKGRKYGYPMFSN